MGIEYENKQTTGKRISKCYKTYIYIALIDNMLKAETGGSLEGKKFHKWPFWLIL